MGKLNELLNSHLRVQEEQRVTASHPSSPDNNPSKWICVKASSGKIHTKSRTSPGTAMCKWVWAQAPKVTCGSKLQELLNSHLRVQEQRVTSNSPSSPDNNPSRWICVKAQSGRVHTKDRTSPGTAMCRWAWAQAPKVIHCKDPFGPQDDYRLKCVKCTRAEDGDSDDSSVNSSDEDAPAQAVQ